MCSMRMSRKSATVCCRISSSDATKHRFSRNVVFRSSSHAIATSRHSSLNSGFCLIRCLNVSSCLCMYLRISRPRLKGRLLCAFHTANRRRFITLPHLPLRLVFIIAWPTVSPPSGAAAAAAAATAAAAGPSALLSSAPLASPSCGASAALVVSPATARATTPPAATRRRRFAFPRPPCRSTAPFRRPPLAPPPPASSAAAAAADC
mmetsp:Transcript_108966/g.264904  ORF Transcript_108966/g.264904 Transcript_108966/m.264904 type:complete len:206 (+) Transcript_108966:228-845(+)